MAVGKTVKAYNIANRNWFKVNDVHGDQNSMDVAVSRFNGIVVSLCKISTRTWAE